MRPPISSRTDTLFPIATRCRSLQVPVAEHRRRGTDHLRIDQRYARPAADRVDPFETLMRPVVGNGDDDRFLFVGQARQQLGRRSRSEEQTSELQSLMRISYAVFGLTKKKP